MNLSAVILATKNRHKITEINACLKALNLNIKSFNDLNVLPEIEETGTSFEENAYIKSKETALFTSTPCLADDSGLVIPSINGEPGVYSARYAGENARDEDRMNKVLGKLANKTNEERKAYFQCVLILCDLRGNSERVVIASGQVDGYISQTIRGEQGFGYDAIFVPNGYNQTFAELGSTLKNKLSHRKMALDSLVEKLKLL
ncbi:MAG: RdgB/HAM1 family non-canonical purine NTP pyrophosphatase [Alphaproteobacteria bacterium]|nr:RdgB/HAM1 family non-canonical purine NTP pyrophosphatase [Alphaproteobacteria bacterium]